MPIIPNTYKNDNEEYITIYSLKKISSELNLKISGSKASLYEELEAFGEKNDENREVLLCKIDEAIKEGTKEVYISKFDYNDQDLDIDELFEVFNSTEINGHVVTDNYGTSYKLSKVSKEEYNGVKYLSLFYGVKLFLKDSTDSVTVIDYPIMVDIYVEEKMIAVRAKSRSILCVYNGRSFDRENQNSTTAEKECKKVLTQVLAKINAVETSAYSGIFKNKLFSLLDEYTHTPDEIKNKIDEKAEAIKSVVDTLLDITNLNETQRESVNEDIGYIVEKYISIHWPDKNVFTTNRNAYPTQLGSTDEEESTIKQTAKKDTPLQSRAIFFDNKRMLYSMRSCEEVGFNWLRSEPNFVAETHFLVKLKVSKNRMLFKFLKYTKEKDIQNVLCSIIRDL